MSSVDFVVGIVIFFEDLKPRGGGSGQSFSVFHVVDRHDGISAGKDPCGAGSVSSALSAMLALTQPTVDKLLVVAPRWVDH